MNKQKENRTAYQNRTDNNSTKQINPHNFKQNKNTYNANMGSCNG